MDRQKTKLLKKMAQLETANDHLLTELAYINELMKKIGFDNGIATVKAAAESLVNEDEPEAAA